MLSISFWDSQGHSFLFGNNKDGMYKDGKVDSFETLYGNLQRLDLFNNGLNCSISFLLLLWLLLNVHQLMIITQWSSEEV